MIHACDLELTRSLDSLTGLPKTGEEAEVEAIITEDVWPTFFATAVGQELKEKYEWSQSLSDAIQSEMARRFGVSGKIKGGVQWPGGLLVFRLEEILGDFIRTKNPCLVPKDKPASAAVDNRPRGEHGQFISQAKADVQSDLSGEVSTVEIKQKRAGSVEYDQAFRKETQIPEPQKQSVDAAKDIREFAAWYEATPASATGPSAFRGGRIKIHDGRLVTRAEYDDLLAKADALIRGGSVYVDRGVEVKTGGM